MASKPSRMGVRNPRAQAARGVKQPYQRKKPTVASVDKKIKTLQTRQELKWLDTNIAQTMDNTGAASTLINGIAQGNSAITRTGNEIVMTSVQYKIKFVTDVDRISPSYFRFIIVFDKQANGAAPTLLGLATAPSILDNTAGGTEPDFPYNHNYQKRYKIIHDELIVINPNVIQQTTVATGVSLTLVSVATFRHKKIPLSKKVKYDSTTAAIGDIATGSLYVYFLSEDGTDAPIADGTFRVYYKDD